MRPEVCETAEELYTELAPITGGDEERGWPLLLFLDGLASALFEPIHELVTGTEDREGWEIALDPDIAPARALPWLAQFAGVELTPAMSEAQRREKIKNPDGPKRGTPAALRAAVQETLTGARTVVIDERYGGSAYQLRVRTLTAETPNEAATLAAILSQKPMGIVLTYDVVDTGDWDDVAAFDDWDDVASERIDWADVAMTPPA